MLNTQPYLVGVRQLLQDDGADFQWAAGFPFDADRDDCDAITPGPAFDGVEYSFRGSLDNPGNCEKRSRCLMGCCTPDMPLALFSHPDHIHLLSLTTVTGKPDSSATNCGVSDNTISDRAWTPGRSGQNPVRAGRCLCARADEGLALSSS